MDMTLEHTSTYNNIDEYLARSLIFAGQTSTPQEKIGFFDGFLVSLRTRTINRKLEGLYAHILQQLPVKKANFEHLHQLYLEVRNLRKRIPSEWTQKIPQILRKEFEKSFTQLEKIETALTNALFVDLTKEGFTEEEIQTLRGKFAGWDDWDDDEMDEYYEPREISHNISDA